MTYQQIKAIELKNKQRILKVCPSADEQSGIYLMTRTENGFNYAYIGQARHLLTRLAQHLSGYQHIDLSLKKHGLYSTENTTGWAIKCIHVPEEHLNVAEQEYIKAYADKGYQLRNKTSGSQDGSKEGLDVEHKQPKGYYDGIIQGKKSLARELKHIIDLHLDVRVKGNGNPNKNHQKALEKFFALLEMEDTKDEQN